MWSAPRYARSPWLDWKEIRGAAPLSNFEARISFFARKITLHLKLRLVRTFNQMGREFTLAVGGTGLGRARSLNVGYFKRKYLKCTVQSDSKVEERTLA